MKEIKLLEEIGPFMKKIIVQAGKATLKYFGNVGVKYTKKHAADVVTEADLISSKMILSAIKKNFPEHGIISEEDKEYNAGAEYTWIVDPLDGTRNFATKTPYYCILIALSKNKKVIISAAYVPYFDELYFAELGRGAFLNGKRIFCSKTVDFARSYGTASISSKNRDFYKVMWESEQKTHFWINDFGSLAVDALYAADGRRDWFFSTHAGGVWDYAAVSLILKESGCKVTNMDWKEWSLSDMTMLAANPEMHKNIIGIYNQYR